MVWYREVASRHRMFQTSPPTPGSIPVIVLILRFFVYDFFMSYIRKEILEKKDKIEKWIREGQSKTYIAMKLCCSCRTLERYLKKMNIEYKGRPGFGVSQKRLTAYEYSQKTYGVSSNKLKTKLIEEGIKENKCETCNIESWCNKPISFELHHIDDDHYNNNFNNLQILCPNCHSQTNGYRKIKNAAPKKYCSICNIEIWKKSMTNKCRICIKSDLPMHRKTKIEWPPIDKLIEMVKETSYVSVGKKLGVSDNAVRKHIQVRIK